MNRATEKSALDEKRNGKKVASKVARGERVSEMIRTFPETWTQITLDILKAPHFILNSYATVLS